jgi:hypothetical protein
MLRAWCANRGREIRTVAITKNAGNNNKFENIRKILKITFWKVCKNINISVFILGKGIFQSRGEKRANIFLTFENANFLSRYRSDLLQKIARFCENEM